MGNEIKYLLSDSEENEELLLKLQDRAGALSGNVINGFKDDKNGKYFANRVGVFSPLLAVTFAYLYDDETFKKKYPDGFITENICFVPKELYSKLLKIEAETNIPIAIDAFLHVRNLLSLIENQFNVVFSKEDKIEIMNKNIYKSYNLGSHQKLIDHLLTNTPPVVPMEQIKKEAQLINIEVKGLEPFKINSDVINSILFKNPQIHDPENKLHILSSKVVERESVIVVDNMNIEDFKNVYQDGYKMANIKESYDILNIIANEAIKDYDNSNDKKEVEKFVNKLDEKWIPFIDCLSDEHFFFAIEDLLISASNKFGKDLSVYAKEQISRKLIEGESIYDHRRQILIDAITGMSAMRDKNEMRFKQQYNL